MRAVFAFAGAPRTKKNHGRRIRRGRRIYHVQSVAHEQWYQACASQAFEIKRKITEWDGIELPITSAVTVRAVFYRDRNAGDEVGYMQALGDLLEGVGIIKNDRQIHWGGVRLSVDREQPRIEVQLDLEAEAEGGNTPLGVSTPKKARRPRATQLSVVPG